MVGVNVPIPVPLAYYTFGGWKRSGFGDLNQHGPDAIRFYTKTKTVTSRWPSGIKEGAEFVIPTMSSSPRHGRLRPAMRRRARLPPPRGAARGGRRGMAPPPPPSPSPTSPTSPPAFPRVRRGPPAAGRSTSCAKAAALGMSGVYIRDDVGARG